MHRFRRQRHWVPVDGEWVCPVAVYIHRSLKFGPYITCIASLPKAEMSLCNAFTSFGFRGYMSE